MTTKMTETQLTGLLIDWLNSNGFIAWRNNVGQGKFLNKDGSTRQVKFGKKGQSDIFAFRKGDGRFFTVEAKLPGKLETVKPWQQEWIDTCNFFGAVGIITTGLEDLEEQLLAL